jgi:hypothetical protein
MSDFRPGDFKEAVARFRDVVHREGERSESPGLEGILERERSAKNSRVRWAVAAAVTLALCAIPVYQGVYQSAQQRQREAEQEKADTVLMEQVNAGLARSVPRAMSPLMSWAPGK